MVIGGDDDDDDRRWVGGDGVDASIFISRLL